MSLNKSSVGADKNRHLLQMITTGGGSKGSNLGHSDLMNNRSYNQHDEKRRKYEGYLGHANTKSMYLPGTLQDITSGKDHSFLMAKAPERIVKTLAQQRRGSTDFVLADFDPGCYEASHSRENSASSRKGRIAVSYTRPDPPDPDRPENNTPGPNAYDVKNYTIEDHVRKMPKVTLKGREPLRTEEEMERSRERIGESPGPLSYHPYPEEKKKKNMYSVPRSKRAELDRWLLSIPAPGTYSPEKKQKIVGTTVMKRPLMQEEAEKNKEREKSPGPGQYHSMIRKISNGFFRFAKDDRFRNMAKASENLEVSPLKYDPKINMTKSKLPNVKIGKAERFEKEYLSEAPGVGNYQVKLSGLNKISFKFGTQRRFLRNVGIVSSCHIAPEITAASV